MMATLKEIVGLFLKIGCIAFGGPAAHIAIMEYECVRKRQWMSEEHFLDMVGATNLIPGPNSTEMSMHCGFHRGGVPGLILAGTCFILPATLITGVLAYGYARYGSLPEAQALLYGIRPVILAVIFGAVVRLGSKAVKGWRLGFIGGCVALSSLIGAQEVLVILAGGLLGMVWLYLVRTNKSSPNIPAVVPWPAGLMSPPVLGTMIPGVLKSAEITLSSIFFVFLKIGCVLFGSGYVLIAYLEDELITRRGWLTFQQLLDAVAIGQVTPGPVLSTSTFIGYQLGDVSGAVLATLGIFLPSFVFVAILNPFIPKMRASRWLSCFLDAVNVSAVGIMLAVSLKLGFVSLIDWKTWLLAAAAFVVLQWFRKVSLVWVVLGGALAGMLLRMV